jgi:hypothetical protein
MSKPSLLILGFVIAICSGQAIAEPPWQQMTTQRINSSPLWGEGIVCTVMNFSGREIEVSQIIDSTLPGEVLATIVVPPGQFSANGIAEAFAAVKYCAYEWFGLPGELMASACASTSPFFDPTYPGSPGYGCLDLRAVNFTSEDYE